jgi:6-phosphofructokinase 1
MPSGTIKVPVVTGGRKMKTIAILTSGGDAPGMNAAIRAVVRMGLDKGLRVMGVQRGYSGLINGEIFEMNRTSVSDIIHKGGTILRTARCEEFKTEKGREKAAKVLKVFGIDGLVVIGGDGSFTGARLLSKLGIATVGIPGTIDNDLAYTEYTLGFDTALNTVLDAINKLRDTSTSHERVSIVEVMGRNCGDIALYSGIAGGAESVIIPEKGYDIDVLCRMILEGKLRGKMHNLIILAEGVGGADNLAKQVQEVTGIESRATILGHIQRGGSPSAYDRILASKMGAKAVELLIEGKTARVIGITGGQITDFDIDEALSMPSKFDEKLYDIARALSY